MPQILSQFEANGRKSQRQCIDKAPKILIINLITARYGTERKYKDCREISFPAILNIAEFKAQSEMPEGKAFHQEYTDGVPDEYRLILMVSQICVKMDQRDYITFCQIEQS
jgi:hypothetical protein